MASFRGAYAGGQSGLVGEVAEGFEGAGRVEVEAVEGDEALPSFLPRCVEISLSLIDRLQGSAQGVSDGGEVEQEGGEVCWFIDESRLQDLGEVCVASGSDQAVRLT